MSGIERVYLNKGFTPAELEKGVEFEIENTENASESSEDESFYDERFDDFKREINNIGIQPKDLFLPFSELKELMIPISEDGGVMKQLLTSGTGVIIPDKSIVIMQYDAILENEKNPFDSTRLRNRPHKFLLGDGAVIRGLDIAVKTMKKNEISKFLVSPDYGYGKMGCPPRIPGNAQILYVVEILNFYDTKDVIEFEEMDKEDQKNAPFEKIAAVFRLEHQMGNELFKNKYYKAAIGRYRKMVKLLENVSVANAEEDKKREEYLLKLYLNLALCYAKVQNSSKSIINANLALKIDPNNTKVLYRMGCAFFIADEFDKAESFLIRAKKQKPYDKNINKALMDLQRKRKQYSQWESMFCKKAFSSESVEIQSVQEPASMKEFRDVLVEEFQKFLESDRKELRLSPGYTEEEIQIIEDLVKEYKLVFVNKIQGDTKVLKVVKH